MNATATRPHHLICNSLGLLLLALLASCASQTTRDSRLPFHVMVLAPAIVQDGEVLTPDIGSEGQSSQSAGWQTELALSFDSEALTGKLDRATNKRFCKVTVLPPDAQANTAIDRAIQVGADLILKTSLTYDPNIYTELNDRFWLNLPLFA